MKIIPGSSDRELILHFDNLPEFESFFSQADQNGYFDLPNKTPSGDCVLIARTEGSPRTRRIKPLRVSGNRIHILERKPEPKEEKPQPQPTVQEEPAKNFTAADRIKAMTVTERTHLALKADFYERRVLMQENNPKIQEFLLRNPRMTEPEIAWLAKNPLSSVHTLLTIIQNKAWMGVDSVRSGILTNPKTPPTTVFDMIPRLSSADLMRMHQSRVLREDLRMNVEREAKKRGLKLKTQE